VEEIPVSATDSRIGEARGPHYAVVDNSVEPNGYLLLSLGGTNSLPSDFLPFDKVAAQEGFAALALDYPNTVITTSCKKSNQPDPCTLFREEINSGAQVSELVEVDQLNSIEHRLEAALRYQAEQNPERFGDFVNQEGPVWEKIVVVGHSQGAGHAGYLAKKHPLQAAILLAGPQDTTDAGPASWLSAPSATEPSRYLAFLHQNDFFNSESQLAAVRTLRESPGEPGLIIGDEGTDSPVVISRAEVRDGHMSVITPQFSEVWQGLLRGSVSP
jgi:pimeloyl-ACP methyl ester carboxylesterase